MKIIPAYLPYTGMTDVSAKVVYGKLVGENGIYFPIQKTGHIVILVKENLNTQ